MKQLLVLALAGTCVFGQAQKKTAPAKAPTKAPAKAAPKPAAAPESPIPQQFPITALSVEGNKNFSTAQILAASGLKIGDAGNEKIFEAARDRLVQSGFFESVGYKFGPSGDKGGYSATFEVIEIAQSYPVKFERLPKRDEEFRAVLKKADPLFSEKVPGTKQLLERYAKLLEPLAGEKVVGIVSPEAPGELKIVFQPARMPPSVAEVDFTKNTIITTPLLRNAIAGAAVGSVYDEQRFRGILDASLRPLYEARGRLRVSFPKITTQPVTGVNGLRVTVEMSEGETYQFGEFTLDSNTALPKADLLRVADLKKGDLANFNEVNAAVDRMKDVMRRKGYIKAAVTIERKIDDKAKTVDLFAKVDPGRQYTFAGLDIKGLDILTEPYIRKMWGVKEGQPFNPDYPDTFLKGVKEEGILDNLGKTRAETKTDDATGVVSVVLYFSGEGLQPKKEKKSPDLQ